MDLQLRGKRALVTGSSSGIGEGIAKCLAREGAIVAVHGRREKEANRVVREITAAGGTAFIALGDLSKDEEAHNVAEKALSALGGVDILINNAGGYEQVNWMDSSPLKWADMYNHDVLSIVRLVQHLAPQMKQLGWGRFIQLASSAGVQPYAFGPDYSAAKAAIINLSVSLSKDLAGTGITANTISPGPIRTAGFEQLWRDYAKTKGWGDDWNEIERNVVKEVLPNPLWMSGIKSDPRELAIGLGITGIGTGITFGLMDNLAVSVVPADRSGMAAGIFSTMRVAGETIAIALMGAMLFSLTKGHFLNLAQGASAASVQTAELANRVARGDISGAVAVVPAASREVFLQAATQSYISALSKVFVMIAIISFASAVLVMTLIRARDIVEEPAKEPRALK